jgi:hypothetical protein
MEKQTDKQDLDIKDALEKLIKLGVLRKDKKGYIDTRYSKEIDTMSPREAFIEGVKKSQVGMIKIEDVEKILAKYLEDENCDYETWNVEELYEGIKTDLDKIKELKEK